MEAPAKLDASVVSFLTTQLQNSPPEIADALYRNEAVVGLLLAGLSDPCKVLIARLAPLKEAAPWPPLVAWVAGNQKLLKTLVVQLRRLKILNLVSPTASSAVRSDAGSSVSGGGAASSTVRTAKYAIHKHFRETYLCMVRMVAPANRMSCFKYTTPEVEYRMEAPDAPAVQSFAQRQWGNLLKWLFTQSVKTETARAPGGATRPGPALEQILNLKSLVAKPEPQKAQQRPRISRAAFQWLLSDLSDQITTLLFGFHESMKHGLDSEGSSPPPSMELMLRCARITVIMCHLAQAKIAQPLVIENDITKDEDNFIVLCRDIGLVTMGSCTISNTSYRVAYPSPLARMLAADVSRDVTCSDAWILSQMFGARSYQDWEEQGSIRRFALPQQRYHPACLSRSVNVQPPITSETEIDCRTPANVIAELPEGDMFIQPTLQDVTTKGLRQQMLASGSRSRGIVVESNFRVFAYRPDDLEMSVLSNLCEIKVLSPTMVVGVLTRESVMNALTDGLSAEQIIRFFASHSHSSVKKRNVGKTNSRADPETSLYAIEGSAATKQSASCLPENVANQLELWEAQRSSITMSEATLFEFSEEQELAIFPQLIARAKLSQALLCHTPMTSAESQVGSPEFNTWKTEVLRRVKSANTRNAAECQKWFAAGAILVVKSEHRADIARHLKQSHTSRRLPPI